MVRSGTPPIDAPHAEDAFGQMVFDEFHDQLRERPQYRRDDGEVTEAHLDVYFQAPGEWPDWLHDQLGRLDGSVLDVGCGPGKHARYLQSKGRDVLAIDRSPGAIAVAREWGVEYAAVMDMGDVGVLEDTFDGAYVLGKQIALGESRSDLRSTLATLAEAVRPGGTLLADFDRPERRGDGYLDDRWIEDGLASRRFRVEYADLIGPWVDVLMVELDTLEGIVAETPWRIVETLGTDETEPSYQIRLERA